MASVLVRSLCKSVQLNLTRFNRLSYYICKKQLHTSGSHNHFHVITMDVDGYRKVRNSNIETLGGLKEVFRNKIEEYLESSEENIIYRNDLHAMCHLAETEEDLQTLRKMIVRHNKYPTRFTFGPIIMRLLYHLQKPDVALELYMNPETSAIFEASACSLILMDLLYEQGMYEECVEVYEVARTRHEERGFINQDLVTLYAVACAKQGTEEALKKIVQLIKEMREGRYYYTNRTISYAAHLALKLGRYEIANDILNVDLQPRRHNNKSAAFYETNAKTGMMKNQQVICYAYAGELKKALDTLALCAQTDDYHNTPQVVFAETVQAIRDAVNQSEDTMLQQRFNDINEALRKRQCIAQLRMDEVNFRTIYPNKKMKAQNIRLQHRAAMWGKNLRQDDSRQTALSD